MVTVTKQYPKLLAFLQLFYPDLYSELSLRSEKADIVEANLICSNNTHSYQAIIYSEDVAREGEMFEIYTGKDSIAPYSWDWRWVFSVTILFNGSNILIKTVEVEVRRNWNSDSKFPFNTLNIPYRKKKFFIANNCEYISINSLFTRCLLTKEKDILESPIEENKNKYVKAGEKFYKVDIAKCKEYIGK